MGDYLEQAGGTVRDADRNATVVTYANQERQHSSKFLWLFRNDPRIEPGSTISVPFKPPREGGGMNANQLLAYVTSLVATLYWYRKLSGRSPLEALIVRRSDTKYYIDVWRRIRHRG